MKYFRNTKKITTTTPTKRGKKPQHFTYYINTETLHLLCIKQTMREHGEVIEDFPTFKLNLRNGQG